MTAQLARPVATAIQRYSTLCTVHAHMQGNKLSPSLCNLCVCTKCRKLSAALKPTFLSVVNEVRPVCHLYPAMRLTHTRTWTLDPLTLCTPLNVMICSRISTLDTLVILRERQTRKHTSGVQSETTDHRKSRMCQCCSVVGMHTAAIRCV